MKLEVSYFGHLRTEAGIRSETVEIDESVPLGDLLEPICKKRNVSQEVFGESRDLQPSVNILLNGRNIKFLQGFETPLKNGDEISIFPPTGGG